MPRLSSRHVVPGLMVILAAAFLYTLWPTFRDASGPAVEVGDEAPEFTLMSDDGQPVRLSDFRGKLVVLNFWATWCPPCVEETPALQQFYERFAPKGVVVLGVSVDEDRGAYRRFLDKAGVRFPTVRDPDRKVSHHYGTFKYPETYFIDRKGKVVQKVIGKADWTDPQMVNYVEQLLRG